MQSITYHVWSDPIIDILSDLLQDKNIIVYSAEEFEVPIHQFNISPDTNITWIFGGSDIEFYKDYPGKICLWETFWLYNSFLNLDEKYLNKKIDIDKIFISMNHRAHRHRCILMDVLAKHDMLKDGYISWKGEQLSDYNFEYWKPKKMNLTDSFLKDSGIHTLPREYSKSLINLISESNMRTMFVTEKTYHAIFAEKPFIIQGPKGIHRYLTSLGFELYDEIFDYSFDDILDDTVRSEMIVNNLLKLRKSKLNKIKNQLQPKAYRNKIRGLEIILENNRIPEEAYQFSIYADIIKNARDKAKALIQHK